MTHRCLLLLFGTAVACGGTLTDPLADGPRLEGRAVDDVGAPLEGITAFLIDDDVAVERATTDADGWFRFQPSPGDYRVVLHDGEGRGHVVAATMPRQGTSLGRLEVRPLTRWPEVVDVRGVGYLERMTDLPAGLTHVVTSDFDGWGLDLLYGFDGRGGRGPLYRFDPSTGALVPVHDDLADEGFFLSSWLLLGSDPAGRLHYEALTDLDGVPLHVGPRFVRLRVDADRAWFLEPIEIGLDELERLVTYDFRVVRIDRSGRVQTGRPTFGDQARAREICMVSDRGPLSFTLGDEDGRCSPDATYVVDPETLHVQALEPDSAPPSVLPPRGWMQVTRGQQDFVVARDGTALGRWSPPDDRVEPVAWFDCPSCPAGRLVGFAGGDGLFALQLEDPQGRPLGFRVADLDAERFDWFGVQLEVDGIRADMSVEAWEFWEAGMDVVGDRLVIASTVDTAGGDQTLLIAWTATGWTAELHPRRYCGGPPIPSPKGRWLSVPMVHDDGRCYVRLRPADAPPGELARLSFFTGYAGRFLTDESAFVGLYDDPITGRPQLFRRVLDEVAR